MPYSYTTDIVIALIAYIVAAVFLCLLTSGLLVGVFVVYRPQTKQFWLNCDLFYYAIGLLGLITVAVNISNLYTISMANDILAFMEMRFGQARATAASETRHMAAILQSSASSSNVIEWAKVEMEWALQVARAMEGGVMSDEWNRFLAGQGIDLESEGVAALPGVARDPVFSYKQLIVLDLRAVHYNRKELAKVKQFPTFFRESRWNSWLILLTFILTSLALGTRFAKVAAELQGFKEEPKKDPKQLGPISS